MQEQDFSRCKRDAALILPFEQLLATHHGHAVPMISPLRSYPSAMQNSSLSLISQIEFMAHYNSHAHVLILHMELEHDAFES